MDNFILPIGGFVIFTAVMTIVGLTMHDLRQIRTEAKQRRTRRRERKPLVSIVVDDDVAKESIKSLRKSDYRKKEIVFVGEATHGDLVLYLPFNVTLGQSAISRAVNAFYADSRLVTAELVPVIQSPKSLRQLFLMYRKIALAPFTSVRIAYRITTRRSKWPLMIRPNATPHLYRTYIYRALYYASAIFNAMLFAYVLFLAIWLFQPVFLAAYLGFFGIWMIMAIMHNEDFSLLQKIIFILLAPTSLGFFAVLAFIAPIRPAFRLLSHLAAALSLRAFRQHAA